MENQIREYVEGLFKDAPYTQRVYELKIELIHNLTDKYADLISEGKRPDDAYNLTILGIGDVNELIAAVGDSSPYTYNSVGTRKKRSAALISISVMLYILSVVPVIIFTELGLNTLLGVVIMFICIAAATGLIIYNSMTKPKAGTAPETVVQEFKEWQNAKSKNDGIVKAIMSAFWPICLALYFLLSFTTGRWDITWIIFLISPAVSGIIKAIVDLRSK